MSKSYDISSVMDNRIREKLHNILQRLLNDVNETISGANALVPWFNLPLFLRELLRALCIYFIVRNSIISTAAVVLYLVISAKDDDDHICDANTGPSNLKKVITLNSILEVSVSFLLRFCFVLIFYYVPLPSLVFLTFVRTWLDSFLVDHKMMDERLLLEQIDDKRLRIMLQRLGMQAPAWLSTPDHQRVEWLNKILVKLWPHICLYLEDWIAGFVQSLQPKMDIKDLNPGDIAPRVSSVKVREGNEQLFINISITYGGNFSGCVKWFTGVEFEVDHLQAQADIQLELKDFVGHVPFVGTVIVHMREPPVINPTFQKMASSIETFKPVKKAVLDYLQNSLKSKFPFTIQLVPELEDLIENLNYTQSEASKSTSSENKNISLWNIVTSRPLLDETKPSQIMSFLQDRNSGRKRSSEVGEAANMNLEGNDSSSVKSTSNSQEVRSLMSSSPQSIDWYISSPSNQSLISATTASQLSVISSGNESSDWLSSESGVTLGTPSSESLAPFNSDSSESIKKSSENVLNPDNKDFHKSQDIDSNPDKEKHTKTVLKDDFRHAFTSPDNLQSHCFDERTNLKSSSELREEELRATISRDVEASREAFLEGILTDSDVQDGYIKKKEGIEPVSSELREGLAMIRDVDQGHGCIELTTRYQAPNVLVVTVHKVRNLPKKVCRMPNPYVKLHLQNQQLKPLTEVTTEILEDTQNPLFEESFEFKLEHPLSLYTLRVSAKTKHKMTHKLGQVVLCFARYTSSQMVKERNWYELSDPKKDYVMCWVGYKDPLDANHKESDYVKYGDRASLHMDDYIEQNI